MRGAQEAGGGRNRVARPAQRALDARGGPRPGQRDHAGRPVAGGGARPRLDQGGGQRGVGLAVGAAGQRPALARLLRRGRPQLGAQDLGVAAHQQGRRPVAVLPAARRAAVRGDREGGTAGRRQRRGDPERGQAVGRGRGELEGDHVAGQAEDLGQRLHAAARAVGRRRRGEHQRAGAPRRAPAAEQRERRLGGHGDGVLVAVGDRAAPAPPGDARAAEAQLPVQHRDGVVQSAVLVLGHFSTAGPRGRMAISLPTGRLDNRLTSLAFFAVEPRGPVAVCTLDKPPANTLDEDLYAEIDALVTGLELSEDVRAAVIASAHPTIFVAGSDIKRMATYDFRPGATGRKVNLVHATFRRLERVGVPTVAAIAGHALGGGCELALACDFRVMSEGDARIGLPEIGLGIIPGGGGTQRLARLVGRARATDMLMLGTRLPAAEAERVGLVNAACPTPEATLAEAIALAGRLAEMPAPGLRLIKRCLNDGVDAGLDHGLAIERDAVVEALAQPEAREGIAAFVERRPPRFHG